MARRKGSTGHTLSSVWRIAVTAAWCIMATALLALVVRYAVTGSIGRRNAAVAAAYRDNLERVAVPAPDERLEYCGFTVYFNRRWHLPWCVAYELTRSETNGGEQRYGSFETDSAVAGCARPWDYTGSGYQRGHMAPAADFKWSARAMRESFKMTNVCPQSGLLNSGGWSRLEEKVREWARRDSALIVATGPIVDKGHRCIGGGVAVPRAFFKVVLAPHSTPMRAIGFIYPNAAAPGRLQRYAVSVDSVERATGLDFFGSLPPEVESEVESTCNLNPWLLP